MALRLVEIFLPAEKQQPLFSIIQQFPAATILQRETSQQTVHTKLLMNAEHTEELLDKLEAVFSKVNNFRIIIISVEAAIPRLQTPEPQPETPPKKKHKLARVSREELYSDIHEASRLTWLFTVMVVLSAIVAAIGLIRDNAAVVIGAMVIAPLLGPNVSLALAATLGDSDLANNAKKANIVGIILPLCIAVIFGIFIDPDALPTEILSRTQVCLLDILLALAAGCAATLSFTMALSQTLVGVMVAVALIPPLVTFGILLGSGQWLLALGAAMLFAVNLICINLAGVMTFLMQGVNPLWWWDKEPARKATKKAIIIWITSLTLLIALIIASNKWLK